MALNKAAVALAVRAHPRGGPPSGDARTVERLKRTAAILGKDCPEAIAGPSSMTPEGTLLLSLSSPRVVMDAIRTVAEALRPDATTFCVVTIPDSQTADPSSGESVDSMLMAADSSARTALRGIEETDVKDQRVRVIGPHADDAIESLIDLVLVTYDGMTDRQRQIITLTRSSETQQEVATHLAVSRQAINQSLAAAGWSHLRRAEDIIESRLAARRRGERRI